MKILIAASGDFALPTFAALLRGEHSVVALITQPDRPAGRGRHLHTSSVKQAALDAGIPILQPERIAHPDVVNQVADLAADVFLVIAYGQKVPESICRLPPLGAINLHASLLPALRGAAPANWAIINGLRVTGVSVMYLAPRIDAGDVLGQRETAIRPHETGGQLVERLSRLGAGLAEEVLQRLAAGTHQPIPQDERLVTYAPRLRKEDGLLDWNRTAEQIDCFIRGMQPWPAAFTWLHRRGCDDLRIIIEEAHVRNEPRCAGLPAGEIIEAGPQMIVSTGTGAIELLRLKPESSKAMTGAAFCNGHAVRPGMAFASPPLGR